MSVEKKVPEIRFKGFSGEWYEIALSNVIDIRSGKDYKHLGKGNIPVYGTGGYMLSVDSALSNDEDAIGIGRKGTIDKPCILRAPFWTVDTLFYSVPFSGFNLDFLFCLFQKIEWKKHDESTGVPSLSKIAINNVPVYATNELEQTAIGNYFQKLDSLINQHQQKHDKLSSIKKAMLEKMFPKQGDTIPVIRFKGFSGEWEEIVLANACLNFRSGKFIKAEDIKRVGAYPVYGGNGLRGYTSEYNHEGTYALIGRQGALCGNMNFSNGKAFFTEHAIAVQANEKNDTLFLYYKLGLMNLGQYSGQSAQPGLSVNKLTELEIFSPAKAEQITIGSFFQKLDALINQHQQQIAKLNNIKQACLSKMFI